MGTKASAGGRSVEARDDTACWLARRAALLNYCHVRFSRVLISLGRFFSAVLVPAVMLWCDLCVSLCSFICPSTTSRLLYLRRQQRVRIGDTLSWSLWTVDPWQWYSSSTTFEVSRGREGVFSSLLGF